MPTPAIYPFALWLLLLGCAGTQPPTASMGPVLSPENDTRLAELWSRRRSEPWKLSIGVGDVLEVTVPDLPELTRYVARVSGDGILNLPLIGTLKAEGLTEDELSLELRRRLEKIMRDPSVLIFVTERRHGAVGVIGSVASPGYHHLSSRHDTLLDAISRAGGATDRAAPRVLLYPAENDARVSDGGAPQGAAGHDFLVIGFEAGGPSRYVNLPARPGDVLLIPDRGRVQVNGWVRQPGSFEIAPGLTVLGAVAAAGGARYAADKTDVLLVREDGLGGARPHRFNLHRLESGDQKDTEIISGDVVIVASSTPKVITSSVVEFLGRVLSVGTF